jgi:hypothetical protein
MDIYSKRDQLFREVSRLRDELSRVESEAVELDTLIRLGEKYNALNTERPRPASELMAAVTVRIAGVDAKPSTLRERIIWAVSEILKDGRRRFARDLLPVMKQMGVDLGGKNPSSNLSAYLSREKDIFVCDVKAGGWTLHRLQKKVRPEDVAASRASVSTAH